MKLQKTGAILTTAGYTVLTMGQVRPLSRRHLLRFTSSKVVHEIVKVLIHKSV